MLSALNPLIQEIGGWIDAILIFLLALALFYNFRLSRLLRRVQSDNSGIGDSI